MPYCRNCHNTRMFGCSKVPPAAPTASGPITGLYADFDAAGHIEIVTRLGADKAVMKEATDHPAQFFDICLKCGSSNVDWNTAQEG